MFVLPSVDEAFGVAYVEAMAGGLPAIGCRGEPGPEEIAAAGGGIRLVAPGDTEALADEIDALLADPAALRAAGARRARPSRPRSRGSAAGARRCAPTRTRSDEPPGPVRHEPRAARTARARSRRCTSASGSSSRCSAAARTTPRAASRTPASRTGTSTQREVHALAASGRYRAVVAGTAGRVALPAAWLGARRARVPFVLWSALWAEMTTPAHVLARPLMAAIYRDAAAVVAYGPHVAAFARAHGARRVEIAPQAVDNAFWSAPAAAPERPAPFTGALRRPPGPGEGRRRARRGVARRRARPRRGRARPRRRRARRPLGRPRASGCRRVEPRKPAQLLRGRERCGHTVDPLTPLRGAVGARRQRGHEPALRRHRHRRRRRRRRRPGAPGAPPGSSSPPATARRSAAAIRRLHDDPALRARLAEAGARAVTAYTYEAWASRFRSRPCGHDHRSEGLLA